MAEPVPAHLDPRPAVRVYLSGPEVFLPDAADVCYRAAGVFAEVNALADVGVRFVPFMPPVDSYVAIGDVPNPADAQRIYRANLSLLEKADCLAANVVPFRGPGMDPGTAFEMGYMRARGLPLVAYEDASAFPGGKATHSMDYADRVAQDYGVTRNDSGCLVDRNGVLVPNFGLPDNLMPVCSHADYMASDIAASLRDALLLLVRWYAKSFRHDPGCD